MSVGRRLLAVLEADPGLAAAVPVDARDRLRAELLVPRHDVPAGPWRLAGPAAYGEDVGGLLVVGGGLTVEVTIADRGVAMLVGPGDVIDPLWATEAGPAWTAAQWYVDAPLALAALDRTFTRAAQQHPALALAVQRRLSAQLARAMTHAAVLG